MVVAAAVYFSDQSLVFDSWNGIIFLMVFFWSSRLLIHLFVRSRGEADDRRYLELAKNWKGSISVNAYFRIFMVQFILSGITSLILYFSMQKNVLVNCSFMGIFGSVIWTLGFIYESKADYDLYIFKKNNPGKRLLTGLWKYSKHPNYFGEILVWWGIFFVSLEIIPFYYGIISPIMISFLLLKVSGVPMQNTKPHPDPDVRKYLENTPDIFPRFWRKK